MKKGVVILIIIGSLCYFGIRWYSRKHPEDSSISRFASIRQWASTRSKSESEVIYEKDIILETSTEKKASTRATPQTATSKKGTKPAESGLKTQDKIELAESYLKEGKKHEARNALSDAYFAETSDTKRKQLKEKLDKLNEELVFSPNPSKDTDVYVVKPGDTLTKIAKQYNTPYELIMRLNKKQNTQLKVNEQLKILKGKVDLLVDKSDFTLTVRLDGNYIKQSPIGTGVAGKTPVGTFKVKDKLKNPVWYSPEGVYEYGNPKNILGTRWLGFEDKPGLRGYGIHGTTQPDSIGKESSMGCIRMFNEDVEDIYAFVVPGTEVIIQE